MDGQRCREIGAEVGAMVAEKNAAYGDAARKTPAILEELFPEGVPVERFADACLMVRVIDKLCRLATAPAAFGESPWLDIAGYAVRGLGERRLPADAPTWEPDEPLLRCGAVAGCALAAGHSSDCIRPDGVRVMRCRVPVGEAR